MDRKRYRRITFFFARMFLSLLFWEMIFPRIGLRKLADRTRPDRLTSIARGYHRLAVRLGGVMIKVGQFLSARMDVFPAEITDELAGLQDEVPAEDPAEIIALAEHELGAPLNEKFASFEREPLAAASLGQVHRAVLLPDDEQPFGTEVVVKVQRPEIETIIATDLSALQWAGRVAMRYKEIGRRVDIPSLLAEFSTILYEEIDYLAEGRNADTFAENFKGIKGVRVPAVVWSHTTKRVLTLEDVFAIKINSHAEIDAAGVDRSEVAVRLFDTYMRQIFEDGFFHADPHPGNLFVDPDGTEEHPWLLTFIDFGMVGHIPPNMREGLREFLIGLGTKDAGRMVKSYQILGILLPGADLELIEQAESAMFEKFWGKSMDELRNISFDEMHNFAQDFRELVYEMPFQVPQDLVFLFRTVAILSGICTGLDPDFNLWTVMNPYTEKMIAQEAGAATWLKEAGLILQTLIALPRKAESVLDRMNRGSLTVQTPAAERQLIRINQTLKRLVYSVIFLGLLTNGVLIQLNQPGWLGIGLLVGAGVSLVLALLPRRPRRPGGR